MFFLLEFNLRNRGGMNCSGLSTVCFCLMLFIHMSAPAEAKRAPGTRRVHLQPLANTDRLEGAESIPLDLTPVKANVDGFLVQLENLAQSSYTCSSQQLDEGMRLHLLKNESVTCNDGSPAGWVDGLSCDLKFKKI